MNNNLYRLRTCLVLSILVALVLNSPQSAAGGKVGVYGIRMAPYDINVEAFIQT